MEYKFSDIFSWESGKPVIQTNGSVPVYGSNGIIGFTDIPKYKDKIILGRVGAYCGSVEYCKTDFNATDNTLVTTCDTSKILYGYAYYLLKQYKLNEYSGGSAQPLITQGLLKHLKCNLPSLAFQEKIISILDKYEKIIENNNKRIKKLEQMAEHLYKEWFVRFRFPGYENAEFENGIPKGWKTRRFSSVANILSGGTPKTEYEEYYGGQIPFYTPKDSADNFFVFDTITKLTEDGLRHCNSQLYPQNTIMITARGTVGNLNLLAVPMAMNQSCYALNSDTISSQYFLFFLIKREIQKLKKMASGGVFDTIIVNTFDHIKVLLPTDELINKFDFIVSSIMKEVYSLSKQNINLIKQRDLLLPRLMSGKLEV